jgi:hypothetical protein
MSSFSRGFWSVFGFVPPRPYFHFPKLDLTLALHELERVH